MAQKTIGELDAATTPLDGTEEIEIEQSSETKKATAQDVADLARVSGGTEDNLVSIDGTELIEDSGIAKADVSGAISHAAGDGSDHSHVALNDTHRTSDGKDHSDVVLNNTHRANNNQAHTDYLKNDADDITSGGLTTTADKDAKTTGSDGAYLRNIVLLEDGDADPTASNFPRGTLFIWYTP